MKKLNTLTLISLLFLINVASAKYSWPNFTYPDKQSLQNVNYLTNNSCPAGQVKLINNIAVNLGLCNSKGSCPSNWEWISRSDEKCHDFIDTEFLNYKIMHFPNENFPDYSMVVASYGSKTTGDVYFQFIMTTPRGEYWYCIQEIMETNMIIRCANDI